jgi:hypothetical protein
MQALKALVIFLAVLIVAGMALLVYGLITRTGGTGSESSTVLGRMQVEGCAFHLWYNSSMAVSMTAVFDRLVAAASSSSCRAVSASRV